jgi:hypothetical protein
VSSWHSIVVLGRVAADVDEILAVMVDYINMEIKEGVSLHSSSSSSGSS